MKLPFELQRVRDFGEVINDTFTFFKDNFKTLMRPLLVICGFFILLGTVSFAFMYSALFDGMTTTMTDPAAVSNTFNSPYGNTAYLISAFVFYVVMVLYQFSVFLTTYSYIAIYKDKANGEKPTVLEVWGYYKYYFWRCLGSAIVVGVISLIGTVLCVLPGIYLGIVLSLLLPIMVFENGTFSFSFNRSFALIKDNWWFTFGVLFIMLLILTFGGYIVSLPASLLMLSKMFLKWDTLVLPLLIIGGLLTNIYYLAYSIIAVALSLCYFSHAESKDGLGLMGRIDMLGKTSDDDSHLPTEQY